MSFVANLLANMASGWASARGRKRAIRIGKHDVNVKYVKPENTSKRLWENDHYDKSCIYIGDSANPVRIDVQEAKNDDEVKLVSSDYLFSFMKMTVIRKALNTKGGGLSTAAKVAIINVIITLMVGMAVVGVTMQ